jgi:hypothetical protein
MSTRKSLMRSHVPPEAVAGCEWQRAVMDSTVSGVKPFGKRTAVR